MNLSRPGWGPWRLDPDTGDLWIDVGIEYRIHLPTQCRTPACVLDWVCQVAGKPWGDTGIGRNAVLAGFVRALVDVLDPQGRLCSWGNPTDLTADQVRLLIAEAAKAGVPV